MASEKMHPISAILHKLRRYCEDSVIYKKERLNEGMNPEKMRMIMAAPGICNVVIAVLCDLLGEAIIPSEDMDMVISELEALSRINNHCAITVLIVKLKES